jgi:hypothetical protein
VEESVLHPGDTELGIGVAEYLDEDTYRAPSWRSLMDRLYVMPGLMYIEVGLERSAVIRHVQQRGNMT